MACAFIHAEGRREALGVADVVVQGRSGGRGVKAAAKAPRGTTNEGEQGQALPIPPDTQLSAGGGRERERESATEREGRAW